MNFSFQFGLYTHPLLIGDYPPIVREIVNRNSEAEGFEVSRLLYFDDIDYVKGTTDFLGINYYTSTLVIGSDANYWETPSLWTDLMTHTFPHDDWPNAPYSNWLYSAPEGFYGLLTWIRDRYDNIEVYITENGWSDLGEYDDVGRIEYTRDHLAVLHRAIEDGCNVTMYAHWCIIDNFEWGAGFT